MDWDGYPERRWLGQPPGLWLGMVLYLLLGGAAVWALRSVELPGGWRTAVALAPALAVVTIVGAYLRMVRRQDELFRRVQLEAIGVAAVVTMVLSFGAWFLEAFGGIPRVSIQWAGILLFFSYAAAAGVLMRRYT